jgi:hypothetical protein
VETIRARHRGPVAAVNVMHNRLSNDSGDDLPDDLRKAVTWPVRTARLSLRPATGDTWKRPGLTAGSPKSPNG